MCYQVPIATWVSQRRQVCLFVFFYIRGKDDSPELEVLLFVTPSKQPFSSRPTSESTKDYLINLP